VKKSNVKNKRTGSGVSSRSAYEYGSTARQLNTAQPLRRDEETEESREQRKARQKQIRRNNKINLMYTMVVASVAAVVFFICYQYLNVQAVAKANSDKIIELKSTLNSLKDDNDALESDINASIDYNALYVNELGMVYPGKDQVITYNSKESEYVKQYKDVPDAN
jgi:cell division protein FtsL